MRVRPEQLANHLARGLAPLYLVHGDEPLQIRESLDTIRSTARDQGYDERMVFEAERGFDWNRLRVEAASLSLFAAKRLLELRLSGGKPGDQGARALKDYAAQTPSGVSLVVSTGKLESSAMRSAWVKALDAAGVVVQARALDPRQLPRWVQTRATASGIRLSAEAARLLAERGEGNMLACAQEIDKLGLLYGQQDVGLEQVAAAVFDSARYTLFALIDSALAGDPARTARILRGLRAEGTEPALVLWALGRELRPLCSMAHGLARDEPVEKVMADHKVWESRMGLVRSALRRHPLSSLQGLLRKVGAVDRVVKGAQAGTPWDELGHLSLELAGAAITLKTV